jgi:membrane-associated phospholipid phosphatase
MTISPPRPPQSTIGSQRLLAVAAILAAFAAAATFLDLPTSRFLLDVRTPAAAGQKAGDDGPSAATDEKAEEAAPVARRPRGSRRLPGDLVRLLNLSEVFGYSPSAAIILLAAMLLDPSLVHRRTAASSQQGPADRVTFRFPAISADAIRMVAMTFTGGLTTDLVKLLVTRVRPYAARLDVHAVAVDTFSNIEGVSGTAMRSFPSGHAAVAAGLASALCWRYPRGAPLFIALAAAAAAQRLTSGSHYVSDVAAGAAIAVAWAAFWVRSADRTSPG